ncbi:MAG TPA: DUF1801 domain-containing protein [Herpetosiphonaceae bacterium]
MAGKKTTATTGDVDGFMAQLDHPRKAEIEAIRAIIRGADPRIHESIKWNAPSFSIDEHFATLKLRPGATVQVVFHTGAKVKPDATAVTIDDPAGLLKWAAPDRGVATFADMPEIEARRGALVAIVQQWIAQM